MIATYSRRCQPSFQILSSLELDLLAVKARAADVENVLFVEHKGKRIKRPPQDPAIGGVVRALFPGMRTLDNEGIVAVLVSATKRLLDGRKLLGHSQRELLFRAPWYATEYDCPPDHWGAGTQHVRRAIFEGRTYLSVHDFLTTRATEILEVVNHLVSMHYAPASPSGPVKASRRQSAPVLGHDAA